VIDRHFRAFVEKKPLHVVNALAKCEAESPIYNGAVSPSLDDQQPYDLDEYACFRMARPKNPTRT
jgi:hypothetical protein